MAKSASERRETRQRILDAARVIARERGYQGTTLAMIQREAKVHPGSLYWFFEDKDSLFAALVESAYAATLIDVAPSVPTSPNPVKRVLCGIVDNPARFGLWRFNVQLMLDPDMRDSKTAAVIRSMREDSQRAMIASWVELLPDEVARQRPELATHLAEYALACVEGCVLARVAGRPIDEDGATHNVTRVLDAMVDIACREVGVATPEIIRERIHNFHPREEQA